MFSVPFNVSAKNGKIFATHTDPALLPAPDVELLFRGTNWAGMQSHGCPNHLTWHTFEQYLDRLVVDLEMNLVRLPLSAEWINGNMAANNYICGEYRHMPTLSVLDDVLARLAARGVFVMLDMHTLHSDRNFPLWCDPEPCDDASEQAIFAAWATLAQRYCSRPNVIMADLFNEPRTSWESWREAAQRLGDHVLSYCDRWLIVVEGTGCNSNHGCWWGEHVAGHVTQPVTLSVAERLVLSPHVYGHGGHAYFSHPSFPDNLPDVWGGHWGDVPALTETPLLLGEFGGHWDRCEWHEGVTGSMPEDCTEDADTEAWHHALVAYLLNMGHSGFAYWTLNDNSFKTGGLMVNVSSNRRKWALLRQFPASTVSSLEAFWREDVRSPLTPPTPPPPPSPPPCTARYANCLSSQCCVDAGFSCHRRVGRQYAQCRPLSEPSCVDSESWICPCNWLPCPTPPSPPPLPPPPPTSLPTEMIPSPCPAHCKRASGSGRRRLLFSTVPTCPDGCAPR